MAQHSSHDSIAKLEKMIHGIHIAMLTTLLPDGSLRSRPMATQEEPFDGNLWFLTHIDSAKADEIDREHQVNVAYADPSSNRYVSVSGVARCYRDRQKAGQLWSALHRAWFPEGVDDPSLAILQVHVNYAEYWDGPSNTFIQLAGFLKATLTGKPYHPGDNQMLTLDTAPGENPRPSRAAAESSHPDSGEPTKREGDPLGSAAGLHPGPANQGRR